ncbi:MAG: hypothetical protein V2A66_01325, partial [Pseudomonadota bacterium]
MFGAGDANKIGDQVQKGFVPFTSADLPYGAPSDGQDVPAFDPGAFSSFDSEAPQSAPPLPSK